MSLTDNINVTICYTNMANSPKIGNIPRPNPCNSIQLYVFLAMNSQL